MRYEVRRGGKTLYHTECEQCRYDAETEARMQESGHDIYIDGKKLKRVRRNARDKREGT